VEFQNAGFGQKSSVNILQSVMILYFWKKNFTQNETSMTKTLDTQRNDYFLGS
jgi:hypothetical protein